MHNKTTNITTKRKRSSMMKILTCACFLMLLTRMSFAEEQPHKTDRFAGKWGVFFHYLAVRAGTTGAGPTTAEWSQQIDDFDVSGGPRSRSALPEMLTCRNG
jgi:hypothetical protein